MTKSFPSEHSIVVELLDGSFALYRIAFGKLRVRYFDERSWSEVPAQDILQHLVLDTPVGAWLQRRVILKPVEAVQPYIHAA